MKRLHMETTFLTIIDVQERLVPAVFDKELVVSSNIKLIEGANALGIPILVTQQYSRGLGETVAPIIDAIKGASETPGFVPLSDSSYMQTSEKTGLRYFEKTSFSAFGDTSFGNVVSDLGLPNVIITGIETHVCVLQTALDLLEAGKNVFVAADAVCSRMETDHRLALERLRDEGAVITTVETVLFELTGGAKNPAFKTISNIVK
jgi:nicotinamidase-related amidase